MFLITTREKEIYATAGQAVIAYKGEWVRY